MKKALRVGYNQYYDDNLFQKHLSYVKENISVIDEIAVFVGYSHYGYWDIETSKAHALLVKDRIKQYRAAGVESVGVNLLCTIGHIEEGWDVFEKAPFQYKVNESGTESKSCLCPGDAGFIEHSAKRYALFSDIGADFIWMDDDLRLYDHGVVKEFCYCDKCIQKFNTMNNSSFTRTEIAELIHTNAEIKKAWISMHEEFIFNLIGAIEEAVHEVNPKTEIGYMSIPTNSKREWILRSKATKLRPGDGFYNDERPLDLFVKCFTLQSQIKNMPENITDIQYEYEAFNYQTLEKSKHISELETTLALMSGCNGALYNDNVFYDREDTTFMLKKLQYKWDTLTRLNEECKPCGVYCNSKLLSKVFNEISIPITRYPEKAVMCIASGDEMVELSDSEIEILLKKNLLTDGKGLEALNNRGFGDYCGGRVKAIYDNSMAERFTESDINGNFKNHYRDVFMNFKCYHENDFAYETEPHENAEVISNLETITHRPLGCSLYSFESNFGTKFACDGYLMPNSIKSAPKREQLSNLLDRLSCGRLPVRIKKSIKVMPAVTSDDNGGMNIMLTNASFDGTGAFVCTVRSDKQFSIIGESGELLPVEQRITGDESEIILDNIPAWSYVLLTNKK